MTEDIFSLEKFEYLCYSRQHEAAARQLLKLLLLIDRNYGKLNERFVLTASASIPAEQMNQHVLTRVASAISALFSDPGFHITPDGFGQLINFQRWLSALFAASPFVNADHILSSLNFLGPDASAFQVTELDLIKFCILYSPESEQPLDAAMLWQQNRQLAAALFMALLSPRFLGSVAAHSKREALLAWLPAQLEQIDSLDSLPLAILHDVYMHCSYADLPGRHDIKRPINRLIRNKLAALDIRAIAPAAVAHRQGGKPVMLVLLEWFSGAHSIYRTHSKTLEAARQHFHLVAIAYANNVDDPGRAVFDEVIEFAAPDDMIACLRQLHAVAEAWRPEVFYMPSVGMFPITMFAANLRLARLQVAALGHPATTHASAIDYISVEEDFVGDPACFSEKLLLLPKDGQPYRPSALAVTLAPQPRSERPLVHVAVAATTMKLNPGFLAACQTIARQSSRQLHFHFLIGQAQGLIYPQVRRLIQRYLPQAAVYQHQPYQEYLSIFSQCDMFLSPFPFGNTNGIIDAVTAGIPGVCKTGREVFEHIDEGLFRRLGLPDWCIAASVEEYVAAAVRLADDYSARAALYRELAEPERLQRLFRGRPEILGQRLLQLLTALPAA
ncbi:peptide transporter [Herbaspirillum autotrophicum]|uniref:peptide transporter n=1 Tax=Herbaspirillum autotrophicum TaxID=180195 RepID=UPI00067D12B1|nr:peptide transporter [Herbaspirillum autotrophicum]